MILYAKVHTAESCFSFSGSLRFIFFDFVFFTCFNRINLIYFDVKANDSSVGCVRLRLLKFRKPLDCWLEPVDQVKGSCGGCCRSLGRGDAMICQLKSQQFLYNKQSNSHGWCASVRVCAKSFMWIMFLWPLPQQ